MKTVMIVDDDLHILDACKMIFERAKYRVNALSSGKSILNDDFEEPDLFIIDRQLTGIDGLDICRHLKSRQGVKNTPVFIFSATPHVGVLSQEAGADEFVEKPFKTRDLLALANKYLQDQPA